MKRFVPSESRESLVGGLNATGCEETNTISPLVLIRPLHDPESDIFATKALVILEQVEPPDVDMHLPVAVKE